MARTFTLTLTQDDMMNAAAALMTVGDIGIAQHLTRPDATVKTAELVASTFETAAKLVRAMGPGSMAHMAHVATINARGARAMAADLKTGIAAQAAAEVDAIRASRIQPAETKAAETKPTEGGEGVDPMLDGLIADLKKQFPGVHIKIIG
jgi:hypothetical protein